MGVSMAEYSLVLLDPRHFHAELAAQGDYPEITRRFRCADVAEFNALIGSGAVDPAKTIVVLAGRNDLKAGYALAAIEAGCNVLADKPLAIDRPTLATFERALDVAEGNGLLFSDMMTERMNLWNQEVARLVRNRLSMPRVEMRSVHHFFKTVGGKPLCRPTWYYDITRQGEGLVDVTTHLIDNACWQLFPDETFGLDDIIIRSARRWSTMITPEQFFRSTGGTVRTSFDCFANGEFVASIKGVEVKVSVEWRFEAPPGGGDMVVSTFSDDCRSVELRNDGTTGFKPKILLDGCVSDSVVADPGHESHFSLVVREYLDWLKDGGMPRSRRGLMRVKYRALVDALELARRGR